MPITGGISLSFEFGLDSYSNFFIADPFVRADLSIGDDGFQVAVNEDPGTGDMSLAWDSATGEVYLSGNAAGLLAVDDAVVIMDDQGELSSWIVVAVDPYDVGSDRTRLVLGPEDGESMLSENAFSATVRRGFDVAINLGIFGLTVNNGFVDFDAGLEFGLDGKLNTAGLNSGGGLDQIDPRVGGDFEYAVYLPVELGGVLAGLNDNQGFITAFSEELPGDAGLKELIFSIPQTVRVTGLAELLEMRGISLDMILAALESALDDLVGVDSQLFGRLVGGQQLETFQQAWVPTNTTATGYAPVLDPVTLLPQSQVVLIDQVKSLRLYLWDDNGTQVWGHETGPESSEVLQVYAQRWQSTGVYDPDDFTTINGAPDANGRDTRRWNDGRRPRRVSTPNRFVVRRRSADWRQRRGRVGRMAPSASQRDCAMRYKRYAARPAIWMSFRPVESTVAVVFGTGQRCGGGPACSTPIRRSNSISTWASTNT